MRSSRVVLIPDAGIKPIEMIDQRRWLKSPEHRGEHGAAEKTIAQGVPACRRTCGEFARLLFPFANEAMGAARRPAFPAPSSIEDAMLSRTRTQQSRRGNAELCQSSLRAKAKQSRVFFAGQSGLLRRFPP